ncbi:MAG TPA: MFS transporter [Candidatus Methanoperedenaceae archaeon]|nr:MFS transporter [Candidatus Methanoperedenaceae archaeon]
MNAIRDNGKLFTRDFVLVSLVTLAIFTIYFSLYVTLPVYVESIGGSSRDIGLVIGVFMVSSILVKPLAGWGVDRYGRKDIMIAGLLIILVATSLYRYSSSMILLLMLVMLHGTGWGISTTAATTHAADIAPGHRRGEALGYFGMFSNVAMAFGPAVSVMLLDGRSFATIFLSWSAISLLSLMIASSIHETLLPASKAFRTPLWASQNPGIRKSWDFSGIKVLLAPAFIMFLINISHSSIMSFLPLFALKQGIANPGLVFTTHAAGLLAIRPIAGRLSDVYGRASVIVPGIALLAISQWILSAAPSLEMSILVAGLYGLGFGAIYTSLIALMIDRANPSARGKAMGIFTSSFDLGLGFGSILWGLMLEFSEFAVIYAIAGFVAFLSLIFFYYLVQKEN